MSIQDLKNYGRLCTEDETVRVRAKAIGLNNVAGQIAYAKELGFDFGPADLQGLAQEAGISKNELNEAELERVAGGFLTTTAVVVAAVVVSRAW